MTLFVFEILCILLYGAASALGAFGLRRGHRRAAGGAKGGYLVAGGGPSAGNRQGAGRTAGQPPSGPQNGQGGPWGAGGGAGPRRRGRPPPGAGPKPPVPYNPACPYHAGSSPGQARSTAFTAPE